MAAVNPIPNPNSDEDYALLDEIPDQIYRDIAEVSAAVCFTPIAYVSLVEGGRQWFKATRGFVFEENDDPRSFCAATVRQAHTLIVPDTFADPAFATNPFVLHAPHIRFYAGTPIFSPEGHVLGTVCVIDLYPHTLTAMQVDALEALARQIAAMLVQSRAHARELAAAHALADTAATLQQLTERLQIALRAGNIASWEWHLATGNFIWDEGSALIYGRPQSEMSHIDQLFSYVLAEDHARVALDLEPAFAGTGDFNSEFRVVWPDGSIHLVVGYARPVPGPTGLPEKIIGVNIDITERKLAEAALIRNEKLAAVGRLASSIAHEINNPLESVTNLIYLARHSETRDEARNFLNIADGELRRASAITKQTLRFHKQSTSPTPIVCEALIGAVLSIYDSRIANSNITLLKRKRSTRPILCFEGEIQQVVSNLVGNAIDAMQAEGGCLFIRSRNGRHWRTGVPGLVLTVADTGPGIPPAVLDKIFEAFFTTKGIGGTGLGLWISKDIIDRHHGHLTVRSSQSSAHHGTVFTIFLPITGATAAASPSRFLD